MNTIGIIGANGKIGPELCIVLQLMGARPIAVCRSHLSAALLSRVGIEYRIGALTSAEEANRLIGDCSVVCDLSLPSGSASEIRSATKLIIRSAMMGSAQNTKFVYASTCAVFEMRWHLFCRSVYGANKRFAERFTLRSGRRLRRYVYILRLGSVYGELQPVSRSIEALIREVPTVVPTGPSNSIFVFSIAEALVNIAEGREVPGIYTACSNPQWTWSEVHRYYADREGKNPEIIEKQPTRPPSVTRRILSYATGLVNRNRDLLTGYVLPYFPDIETKAKAIYLRKSAAGVISKLTASFELYSNAWTRDAPGDKLQSISDSRYTMEPFAKMVRERIKDVAKGEMLEESESNH
jgi:nucleoside-diphosphate-sugar epimerase